MRLECNVALAANYHSAAQVARVLTEDWCSREVYCPACDSKSLTRTAPNRRAIDFACPQCLEVFQLKGGKLWNQQKVVDAAYGSMIAAIRSDSTPNLFVLQYSSGWLVQNLLLIPRFFFTESAIERRPPLGPNARRGGWIGCNILLGAIPPDGKITVVANGRAIAPGQVREEYRRIRLLSKLDVPLRGWTLDVLNVVRRLQKREFTLQELYRFVTELENLHPENRNVRPKIRQQLQVLRDLGFLKFTAPGRYALSF